MLRKAAAEPVRMGFEEVALRLAITDIQPLRLVSDAVKKTPKYAQIAASIREVGIVEPPVVARDRASSGQVPPARWAFSYRGAEGDGRDRSRLPGLHRRRSFHLQPSRQPHRHRPGAQDDPEGDRAGGARGAHRQSPERRRPEHPAEASSPRRNLFRGGRDSQGQARSRSTRSQSSRRWRRCGRSKLRS